MMRRRSLLLPLALALWAPATATAAEVRVVVREEPLAALRASAARQAPIPFTMVGIHWQGPGEVWFRTVSPSGKPGSWRPARPEEDDLPDVTSGEAGARAGWNVGNPWWTGEARSIEYRTSGSVERIRTYFVWSPVTADDRAAASSATAAPAPLAARAERPPITRRSGWGADESIVRSAPSYADRVRFAVVHHTAGTNGYSASQSPAIVRGIQRYHVLSNGWNDIGYNFLVDKYGRIFEGRGGGLARNVIGAHAQGFNTGSVGVAVLGTYGTTGISSAARSALERLLAWRLDVAHVDPVALVDTTSYGSDRFPAGRAVRLRAISGHRDTGYTSCPGNALYGRLGAIAANVAGIGLPKLYDPEVSGSVGEAVRFTGRLSATRAWVVQVKDAGGAVIAEGHGNGTATDWTWDATRAPFGTYTWQMSAGADVRPAAGVVPSPPPLDVTGLAAKPATLTPNGDWSGEQTAVSFVLSRRATVVARVENASSGALVRTILPSAVRSAGTLRATWDGKNGSGVLVADGRYRVEVTATSGSEQVTRSVGLKVDRTLGGVSASPAVVSPNGDGRRERLRIGFALTRDATVRVLVKRSGTPVATVLTGSLTAGAYAASWDGLDDRGKRVSDGTVTAVVRATASLGRRSLSRPARLDTTRPVVRVLSLTRRQGVTRVRFTLSEEADVKIWLGRQTWRDGAAFVVHRSAGTHVVRRRAPAGVVRLRAIDLGLTRSAAVVARR